MSTHSPVTPLPRVEHHDLLAECFRRAQGTDDLVLVYYAQETSGLVARIARAVSGKPSAAAEFWAPFFTLVSDGFLSDEGPFASLVEGMDAHGFRLTMRGVTYCRAHRLSEEYDW